MLHGTALTPDAQTLRLTPAQMAAVGFLARFDGDTLTLYAYHLKCWFTWCEEQGIDPLIGVVRTHIELYSRHRSIDLGNSPGTVKSQLSAIRGYFKFASIDGLIDRDPAQHVRIPKVSHDESRMLALDRAEFNSFIDAAVGTSPQHAALAYLLGHLGLRVSEACGVQVGSYSDTVRGYRLLHFTGKGNKPATSPLPPGMAEVLDRAAEGRTSGPLLRKKDGTQANRGTATAMVATICRHAGITKRISPHSLRHSFVTNALDAGVPLRDVQFAARHVDPRTTIQYDRARGDLDRHAVFALATYLATKSDP